MTSIVIIFLLVLSVGEIVLGCFAYTGRYRSWLNRNFIFSGYLGPAMLWIGGGVLMLPLLMLLRPVLDGQPQSVTGPIFLLAFGLGALGVITGAVFATTWMPKFLRPGWVRELEGNPAGAGTARAAGAADDGDMLPAWTRVAIERRTQGQNHA